MSKNASDGVVASIQLCLPGTDDLHFVLHASTFCECYCAGCPPWDHAPSSCGPSCERVRVPPLSNTGVHTSEARQRPTKTESLTSS
jgi:hypothetical protein